MLLCTRRCFERCGSTAVFNVCAAHDKLITKMCPFQYVSPSNLRAFKHNHCCCCVSLALSQLSGCLPFRQNCIFQQIASVTASETWNVCIRASVRTSISQPRKVPLLSPIGVVWLWENYAVNLLPHNWVVGIWKFFFHFVNTIRLLQFYSRFRDDFVANLVFCVASEWSVLHSAWTRVLFVFANRLRYSLYGHKITRRMWEVDFYSCSKRVTLCLSEFFFLALSTSTRFLARPDSQRLKWVWMETKRRIKCDCGTDWTAQIEIWKSKWSSIQMEFKRFVSRLIWINLSGLHVVSLHLFHCSAGVTSFWFSYWIYRPQRARFPPLKLLPNEFSSGNFFFWPPSPRNFC